VISLQDVSHRRGARTRASVLFSSRGCTGEGARRTRKKTPRPRRDNRRFAPRALHRDFFLLPLHAGGSFVASRKFLFWFWPVGDQPMQTLDDLGCADYPMCQ